MNKLLLILIVFAAGHAACAQDIITFRNAAQIQAKIMDVGPDKIQYREWGASNSRVRTTKTKKVFVIQYEDGKKLYIPEVSIPRTGNNFFRWPRYYQCDFSFGYGPGISRNGVRSANRMYFEMINGARFNPYFYTGIGLGIYYAYKAEPKDDDYSDNSEYYEAHGYGYESAYPGTLTVNFKGYYPIGSEASLYLSADIGVMFGGGNYYPNKKVNRLVYAIGPGIEAWGYNFGVLYHHMGSLGEAITFRLGMTF